MNKDMPKGLRWLRIFIILLLIFEVIILSSSLARLAKDYGASNTLTEFLSLVLLGVILLLIYKPSKRLLNLSKILLVIDSVLSVILLGSSFFKGKVFNVVSIALFLGILLNILLIWYLTRIKEYFISGKLNLNDEKIIKADSRFRGLLVTILVLMFVLPMILGIVDTVSTISATLKYTRMFQGNTIDSNLGLCTVDANKDKCLFFLSIYSKNDTSYDITQICNLIGGTKEKYSCLMAAERCDLIQDARVRKNCELKTKYE